MTDAPVPVAPVRPGRAPVSTYRLQFNRGFTFRDAEAIVPYLHDLGLTDCYCSPYLLARPGSLHGYDISDHTRLNPDVGDQASHASFVLALQARNMGRVLDLVPNHMGNDPHTNRWWRDVLENGPASVYGRFFDIDWDPVKPELRGKVLLPILRDQYGVVLERGDLRLGFEEGGLYLDYFGYRLPIDPRHATQVYRYNLDALRTELGKEDAALREFLSIVTALAHLPDSGETDPERIAERHREKEVARQRLAQLVAGAPRIIRHIGDAVTAFNGTPEAPESFDLLHGLLDVQAYRLAYWRTAAHEINYRRFFDINDLAGIRMEEPEVFAATHGLVAQLLADGAVTGLRIDHPDGLYAPAQYFQRVQELVADPEARGAARPPALPLYVVAEKILSAGEPLPPDWAVAGTTGYNFLNDLNGLFVDPAGAKPLRRLYRRLTRQLAPFDDVAYLCKKLITRTALASELNVLAHALNQISEANRRSRDFTLNSLREVLGEVVACFPVYRTYVGPNGWTASDRHAIETAVRRARRRNPALESSAWDFLRESLLPRPANGGPRAEADNGIERRVSYPRTGPEMHRRRLTFAMHFQQYTAPVQAKGVEDTAFYRYNLLVSLNEVGGDPARFGRSPAEFHAAARARSAQWPLEMTATATHDTKLGEDVRARINVLSELPDDWRRALTRWMRINAPNRSVVDADPAPDRNDEYRFYQVLLGTWPADAFADHRPTANTETGAAARAGRGAVSQGRRGAGLQPGDHPAPAYVARLRDYMVKAAKEAKLRTSWVNDNEAYDQAVARFVERSLAGPTSPRFLAAFVPLARRVAHLGMLNALSQVAIKIGSPGVSDFYQGTELWDLRLVDPDNRTPVDYGHRAALLDALGPLLEDADARSAGRKPCAGGQNAGAQAAAVSTLLRHWTDGRIKLFVTAAGLRLRRARPDLFLHGEYLPLEPEITVPGCDVLAFARRLDTSVMLVVAPRLVSALVDLEPPVGSSWGDSTLALPDDLLGGYVNVLTGETVETRGGDRRGTLALADALAVCPVALLLRAS